MAGSQGDLVRVEIPLGNGRTRIKYIRPEPAAESKRANLSCPMLSNDTLPDGTYSGADGQIYTSKAALRASYLPSGNPQGIRYNEVGNETQTHSVKGPDGAGISEAIDRAAARVGVDL